MLETNEKRFERFKNNTIKRIELDYPGEENSEFREKIIDDFI